MTEVFDDHVLCERERDFIKASGATCWIKQGIDYDLIGYPPFSFFATEYMAVGAKHAGNVNLVGTHGELPGL